jgi:hypothetical protein
MERSPAGGCGRGVGQSSAPVAAPANGRSELRGTRSRRAESSGSVEPDHPPGGWPSGCFRRHPAASAAGRHAELLRPGRGPTRQSGGRSPASHPAFECVRRRRAPGAGLACRAGDPRGFRDASMWELPAKSAQSAAARGSGWRHRRAGSRREGRATAEAAKGGDSRRET